MSRYAVEMRGITKYFSGVAANKNITIQIKAGEIHALLGENGAGKSTLMNILFGLVTPDAGEIYRNGEKVTIKDPNDATALGIGMVHQHFRQVSCMTVLDNIILGAENMDGIRLDRELSRKKVTSLSEKYGLFVDPEAKIEYITVGMQQRVEILKMLYRDNDVLIFDEPTAVLTVQEANELLEIMKGLRAEGKAILFISHKMNEIMDAADRCTVIRKGEYVGTVSASETTVEELSEMMVGRKVDLSIQKKKADPGKTVLSVKGLTVRDPKTRKLKNNGLSFDVRAGEIVTIAGIDGNGQDELVSAIVGKIKPESGTVSYKGEDMTGKSIRDRIDAGIGYIPVDRLRDAVVEEFDMAENLVLKVYRKEPYTKKSGVMSLSEMEKYAAAVMEEYDVRSMDGVHSKIGSLSGGNQQKAVVGRELERDPELLIAVQPVRGVDLLATNNIHKALIAARDKGKAVLLVSLELSEVMTLSDRIIVLFEGENVGEFTPETVTREELGLYMTGARRKTDE